jgi:hypothetical protein
MDSPIPKPASPFAFETPADLQPSYANLARISHAPTEFVLDFGRFLPGDTKAVLGARIVMSAVGTKLLLQALAENVARYESSFGTISLPAGGSTLADTLFRPAPPSQGGPPHPDETR